jgi:hypothetical protein
VTKKLGLALGVGLAAAVGLPMVGCLGAAFTETGSGGTSSTSTATGGSTGTTTSTTSSTQSTTSATGCATGQTQCSSGCTDTQLDAENCGTCGTKCDTGQQCCGGQCLGIDDADRCGGCGTRCEPGKTCSNGTCNCSNATTCSATGVCPGVAYSAASCGSSCKVCEPSQLCLGISAAVAGCVCRASLTKCTWSTSCVDPTISHDHCAPNGCLGQACDGGQQCIDGQCQDANACNDGQHTMCGNDCIANDRLQWDAMHCGSSCTACKTDEVCVAGGCAKYFGLANCGGGTAVCGSRHTCCPVGVGAACVAGVNRDCAAVAAGLQPPPG